MTQFLELCQDVAMNSRGGGSPATVTGVTGREQKIVHWTNAAYRDIQLAHWENWRWMRGEFSGSTTASIQRYTGTDLGISDFGKFHGARNAEEERYTIYDPSIGLSDEGQLQCYGYEDFYREKLRGTTQNAKPASFAIDHAGQITFPNLQVPDKGYTIRGPYVKEIQELAADTDTPQMPAHFHRLIVDVALILLETHDEGPRINLYELRKLRNFLDLERDQMPVWEKPDVFA